MPKARQHGITGLGDTNEGAGNWVVLAKQKKIVCPVGRKDDDIALNQALCLAAGGSGMETGTDVRAQLSYLVEQACFEV